MKREFFIFSNEWWRKRESENIILLQFWCQTFVRTQFWLWKVSFRTNDKRDWVSSAQCCQWTFVDLCCWHWIDGVSWQTLTLLSGCVADGIYQTNELFCFQKIFLTLCSLSFQTPENCSTGADCMPMIISWEGAVEIQSGDVLIVEIDDTLLLPADMNLTAQNLNNLK